MEDKKLLTNEELEKVSGGFEFEANEGENSFSFTLEPGESAGLIKRAVNYSRDLSGKLDQAIAVLDAPNRINTVRTIKIKYITENLRADGVRAIITNIIDVQY